MRSWPACTRCCTRCRAAQWRSWLWRSASTSASPASPVDHFAQGLEVAGLEWRRVPPSSFAQGFVGYERVKELELWRVTAPGQDGAGIYVTPREG
jgi:hypothetical protein